MPPETPGADTPSTPSLSPSTPSTTTTTPTPSDGHQTPAATSSGPDAPSTAPSSTQATSQPAEPKTMAEAIEAAFQAKGSVPDADDLPATPAQADAPVPEKTDDGDTGEDTAPALGGETSGTDAAKEEAPDPSQQELAAMPAQTRRRVQQLLQQRKGLREEVTALKPDAEGYRTVRAFMSRNNLADQEVAELFQIGADLKSGDPKRLKAFIDRVMPRVQEALEATGQATPADLRPRVDTGEMTEETARELAAARHARAVAETREQEAVRTTVQTSVAQRQQAIQQAVAAWNAQTRQSDPDFDLKMDTMMHVARSIVAQRGQPTTPAQALAYAKDAYAEATRLASKLAPARAATRPTPNASSTSPTGTGNKPEPKTLAEAIELAMAQGSGR